MFVRLSVAVLLLAFCASCEHLQHPRVLEQPHPRKKKAHVTRRAGTPAPTPVPGFWKDDEDAKGERKIVVSISAQRAYFYKGETLIGESPISTGRKGFDTPPGKYRVIQKDANHVSNLYGDYVNSAAFVVQRDVEVGKHPRPKGATFRGAPMRYFLRFTGGYGMHAGFVPRFRASHGCIRMPIDMAKRFFDAAKEGTPVVVKE